MPTAKLGEVDIKYYTIGSGKPILFISGLGMDHRTWMPQMLFFKEKFKVIVFDNRGMGESTGSLGPYTIPIMAEDAVNLLEHLGIDKAHIVGSSMGGMIAQEMAINYPEKVDKLILCSTTAKLSKETRQQILQGLHNIVDGKVDNILSINPHRILFERAFNYIMQLTFSKEFLEMNKQFIENMLRNYSTKLSYTETLLKQIRGVTKHDTSRKIGKIKAETLVMTGTCDKLIPSKDSEILYNGISNSTLVKIVCGTHGMHHEKANEFNEEIFKFLDGVK
ncbi:MAG TPA: alpha/beta hydrolase [Thermoplasmatales archaeon]|nr:alpha/beta hydrolase [Thermoplasmatales archaeon]